MTWMSVVSAFRKHWPFILAVGILLIVWVVAVNHGKRGEVIKQQDRELETQRDVTEAANKAADQRVDDALRLEQQKRELQDALKATDDPYRRRALRSCAILRQQGRNTADIPACQ